MAIKTRTGLAVSGGQGRLKLAVIVFFLALLSGVLYWWMNMSSGYFAVYLRTGDVYFGKISTFPSLVMTNAYLLQLTGDQDNPFVFNKFSQSIWQPEDKMYINRDNVVWKARISSKSQLVEMFNNPERFRQQAASNVPVNGEKPFGGEEGSEAQW